MSGRGGTRSATEVDRGTFLAPQHPSVDVEEKMRFYLKLFLFIAAFGILARISDPEARASMRDAVLTGRFVMYSFTRSEEGMKDPKWLDSIVTEEQRARY